MRREAYEGYWVEAACGPLGSIWACATRIGRTGTSESERFPDVHRYRTEAEGVDGAIIQGKGIVDDHKRGLSVTLQRLR